MNGSDVTGITEGAIALHLISAPKRGFGNTPIIHIAPQVTVGFCPKHHIIFGAA